MNRKKLASRITALILCAAVIATAANWNDLKGLFIKEIVATEEQGNEKIPEGTTITRFDDKKTEVNLSTPNGLSNINDYLPKTIKAVMDDESEKEIKILNWKFVSAEAPKNGKYKYVYEAQTEDAYVLGKDTVAPLAYVYIKESEIEKDTVVDNGVYSISAKKKAEVCPECFRELDGDGLCSKCHEKDCKCPEADVDLKNTNSILAFGKKYVTDKFIGFDMIYPEIFNLDTDWIRSLPKNKREVVNTLFRAYRYENEPEFYTYISSLSANDFLTFLDDNILGFTFEKYMEDSVLNISLPQVRRLAEKTPGLAMKDIFFNISCMMDDTNIRDNISTNKEEKELQKIANQIDVKTKVSYPYEKNSLRFSSLRTDQDYIKTLTADTSDNFGDATGRGIAYMGYKKDTNEQNGNGPYARYYLRGKGGKNNNTNIYSPAFCGNHGLNFAGADGGEAKFKYIGLASELTGNDDHKEAKLHSAIGSALQYIGKYYKSLAQLPDTTASNDDIHLYTIVQSTIWNATDTGSDTWKTETSFRNSCTTVCSGKSQQDLCALWWLFRYGGIIGADGRTITPATQDTNSTLYRTAFGNSSSRTIAFTLKSIGTEETIKNDVDYDIWWAADQGGEKQPMLTPFENMELPLVPHINMGMEVIRTKMVTRPNINNLIDHDTGIGVIGSWNPDGNDSHKIKFSDDIKDIKKSKYAFYYASKSYDITNSTKTDNDINANMGNSNNPDDWKKNVKLITENDDREGGGYGNNGLERWSCSWRYITPLFYNQTTQFFNYAYNAGDKNKGDSDFQTCIKRHLYGKDALNNIPEDKDLSDLDLEYKCTSFDCQYAWQFHSDRGIFEPISSHEGEQIIVENTVFTVDDKEQNIAPDYEIAVATSMFDSKLNNNTSPLPSFSTNIEEINIKKFGIIRVNIEYPTFTNNFIQWTRTEKKGGVKEEGPVFKKAGDDVAPEYVSGEEIINAPEVLKHKLILHYQGGYLKNPGNIATKDKMSETFITNGETNYDAEYGKSKTDKVNYKDVVTEETVGATFTEMTKEDYSIDYVDTGSSNISENKITGSKESKERYEYDPKESTDGNGVAISQSLDQKESVRKTINKDEEGRLSKLGDPDPQKNRTFTYGKIDGLETVVDFHYTGDYVASLPTPSRYGYNFLGWYPSPNAEGGDKVSPRTDIKGYEDKKALVLDAKTLSGPGGSGANGEKNNDTLTLYAAWELITKDQSFYIDWMDNDNRYSTRPDTVYVQLYRTTDGNNYEQVTKFVTDNIGTDRFNDPTGSWVTRFANETNINNAGNHTYLDNATLESETGRSKYTFGKTPVQDGGTYLAMTDPNDEIYKSPTQTPAPNPYKAFSGDGKFSGESYMKVSLYDNKESTAYSSPTPGEDITGTNSSPASSNRWTFTLRNLQKFDTRNYENGTEEWKEYQYVIKQIHTISKDYTLRYVVSPANEVFNNGFGNGNKEADKRDIVATDDDDSPLRYGSQIKNYYTMDARSTSNNKDDNSKDKYNALANKSFGNGVINRLANIYDEPEENLRYDSQKRAHTYKSVQGSIMFVDGTDKFHFRPYSMVVDLYQNTSANRHDDSYPEKDLNLYGVREIIQSQPIVRQGNPYSSVTNGNLNIFEYKFDHVPTLQEETGIKYGYDVVLTHNQKRYRYTINTNDASDNFFRTVANDECYSYVHKDIITTPVDTNLSANEMGGNSNINYEENITDPASVMPIYQSLLYSNYTITSQSSADTIFEGLTKDKGVTPKQISDNYGKINQYALNNSTYDALNYDGQVASNYRNPNFPVDLYQGKYCSMAYNLRYYYITENRELTIKKDDFNVKTYPDQDLEEDKDIKEDPSPNSGVIDYYYNMSVPEGHRDKELQYKETLKWNFTVTLNGGADDSTSLPTEYTGSESPDDRSGIFSGEEGGSYNSDYTHTQNKLIVKSNVFADDGKLNSANNNYTKTETYTAKPNAKDYERLAAYKECEGFLLTFRQVKKSWLGSGDNVREDYKDNESPLNGFRVNKYTSDDKLSDIHKSFAETVPSGTPAPTDKAYKATAVGNEYNLIVPAEGQTEMMYLPDGRYEITCHADIDLHSFSFIDNGDGRTTAVEKKNNRWFITFSSTSNQTKDTSTPDGQEPVPFDVKNAERENVSDMTHRSELDWWRGYVDDAANIAFRNGTEVDQSFRNHKYDLLTPTNSQHHPTVVLQSEDNINYNKYNNTTKDAGEIQRNGFQVNTWKGDYKNASDTTDKTDAPLQYNNPYEGYGEKDDKAFKTVHDYDAFYIGSHSWAEIRENLKSGKLPEYGQQPYGIGGTADHLYAGNGSTKSTKPKVTGPNTNRITNSNAPYADTVTGKFRTGIIKNWQSSMKQSDKNTDGNSILYTKPKTK